MKHGLESRYGKKLGGNHPAAPWLVRYSAQVMNRGKVGSDGKTAQRRLKGKDFRRDVAEFGECIMYLKLESEGKDKGESRWREGIFLGIRDESGEIVVGTNEGTVKARTLRRYGREEDRWNEKCWDKICGVPWECIPGKRGIELVPDVKDEVDRCGGEGEEPMKGEDREAGIRRYRIMRGDVKKYGGAPGCRSCEQAIRRG